MFIGSEARPWEEPIKAGEGEELEELEKIQMDELPEDIEKLVELFDEVTRQQQLRRDIRNRLFPENSSIWDRLATETVTAREKIMAEHLYDQVRGKIFLRSRFSSFYFLLPLLEYSHNSSLFLFVFNRRNSFQGPPSTTHAAKSRT